MCGNVTLAGRLQAGEQGALPERGRQLLTGMLRVSQMRGAQSGGGAVQVQKDGQARQLIGKCVNSKRGDLATLLSRTLRRQVGSSQAFAGTFIAQTHVRYATAGLTTKHEAHPFRFIDLEQRGPRRVWSLVGGTARLEFRPVETALTHNGDLDGLRFRGTELSYAELGCFLERVLGVRNRWIGDSPVLSAAIELYLTRGMWLESLRLAHHLIVAPPAPSFSALPAELDAPARLAAMRALMSDYPAPSLALLQKLEVIAEGAFQELLAAPARPATDGRPFARRQREQLTASVAERLTQAALLEIPNNRHLAFARAAVDAFIDNDLYIALRKLEPGLEGTFGCVVTSTLEPGCLVALCRGQPLSMGFDRATHTACVVSERAALKVPGRAGELVFEERIDLDLCRGEVARVVLSSEEPLRLTLYGIADGREYESDELIATGRLVPIRSNPYVSRLPPEAPDRVAADMRTIVPLLHTIRADWWNPSSPNRQSAQAFAEALQRKKQPRLLVLGITNDLWLAEQFVLNLVVLMPEVRAAAHSSNAILAQSSTLELDANTVVLAVSQAGQDFPTLGALILLKQRMNALHNDAVFVLTGELDSLMGQAVGQSYARGASFSGRVFHNHTGFRPSEAAVATVNATHHTLVELLLFLARHACGQHRAADETAAQLTLAEVDSLCLRRDFTVDVQAAAITQHPAPVVARQAARWSRHVLEGALGFAALVLLLELNLGLGLGLVPSRAISGLASSFGAMPGSAGQLLGFVAAQADVLFYAFFAPFFVWLLRRLQGRSTFHRQGTRELLIGDCRYVHQIIWLLSKKLFSLSYGFASIKPYSADCQDELVMTHEPLRGTLAIMGIPDAQRTYLRGRGQAALMTAKQFNNSRSLAGAGAEIVTISHALASPGAAFGAHVALARCELPAARAKVEVLLEGMFDSWERLLAMQVFLDEFARRVSTFWPFRYDRSRTKDQVFAPTTAAPVSAAAIYQLLARTSERYDHTHEGQLPFEMVRSDWRGSAPAAKTTAWQSWTEGPPSQASPEQRKPD